MTHTKDEILINVRKSLVSLTNGIEGLTAKEKVEIVESILTTISEYI